MPTRLGVGSFIYEVADDWAKLPAGWSFYEVADVAVDCQDRVYVFNRVEQARTLPLPPVEQLVIKKAVTWP